MVPDNTIKESCHEQGFLIVLICIILVEKDIKNVPQGTFFFVLIFFMIHAKNKSYSHRCFFVYAAVQ